MQFNLYICWRFGPADRMRFSLILRGKLLGEVKMTEL